VIVFRVERYADVIAEIRPLLERHYEEIAAYKQFPLQPDWATYIALDRQGKLLIVTARQKDMRDPLGTLIGYAIFLVVHHLHYTTQKLAVNDLLFLDKPYRRGSTGIKLITAAEAALAERGVDKVQWHVKPAHDWGKLLERRGYVPDETIWAKILEKN
jgi:GNAT superfamily N-acetyltransferase